VSLPDRPKNVVRWEPQLPRDWCEALGKVALFSSQVEEELHLVYWHYLGISSQEGQLITGDTNPKRLSEDIVKIGRLNCKNKRRLQDLELLVDEFGKLVESKNKCIHWIWSSVIEGRSAPGRPIYKTKGREEEFEIPKLNLLGDDLAWLTRRLTSHHMKDSEIRSAITRVGPSLVLLFWPAPWLHKRVAPATRPSKTRDSQKSSPRQPRSSPT
jgi:hypothetical protein